MPSQRHPLSSWLRLTRAGVTRREVVAVHVVRPVASSSTCYLFTSVQRRGCAFKALSRGQRPWCRYWCVLARPAITFPK